MASNLKVDIVKPTATNGSLSLKGDSGGSATTNGISVDSSGNTSISGSTSLDGAVTINESGADVDFRVESDTVDHALFVEGSSGNVGVGTNLPAFPIHIKSSISGVHLEESDGTSTHNASLIVQNADRFDIQTRDSSGTFVATDYQIVKGASGATTHTWTIANSTAMSIDSSGNLKFNSGYGSVATAYGCRAWVNFDGTFGTSPFTIANGGIRASGNVSSVTDNGTGDYTVTFADNMPDTDFSVVGTCRGSGGTGIGSQRDIVNAIPDTAATALVTTGSAHASGYTAGVLIDNEIVSVQIFR